MGPRDETLSVQSMLKPTEQDYDLGTERVKFTVNGREEHKEPDDS